MKISPRVWSTKGRNHGFTLLEFIIASGLFLMIVVGAYKMFGGAMLFYKKLIDEHREVDAQLAGMLDVDCYWTMVNTWNPAYTYTNSNQPANVAPALDCPQSWTPINLRNKTGQVLASTSGTLKRGSLLRAKCRDENLLNVIAIERWTTKGWTEMPARLYCPRRLMRMDCAGSGTYGCGPYAWPLFFIYSGKYDTAYVNSGPPSPAMAPFQGKQFGSVRSASIHWTADGDLSQQMVCRALAPGAKIVNVRKHGNSSQGDNCGNHWDAGTRTWIICPLTPALPSQKAQPKDFICRLP